MTAKATLDELRRACAACGAEFYVNSRSRPTRYCGKSCSGRVTARSRTGTRNANWRGGKTQHPLYEVYKTMIVRCHAPTNKNYPNYGGRGITVCERWRNDFWAYVTDIGERPAPGMSIDRIDNDGNYEPGNVRWATPTEQRLNTRPPKPATHCKRGHEFTEANTIRIRATGRRTCRECTNARQRVTRPAAAA